MLRSALRRDKSFRGCDLLLVMAVRDVLANKYRIPPFQRLSALHLAVWPSFMYVEVLPTPISGALQVSTTCIVCKSSIEH